jgi:uncharacterized protein Veg
MKTIFQARDYVKSIYGKKVRIKVHGIRNKVDIVEGVVSELYNQVFIIKTKFGNKSFTYSDVLIGNINLTLK